MFRRATLVLLAIRVTLRLRGYKKTQGWLQEKLNRQNQTAPPVGIQSECVEMTCRMVRAAEHYAPGRATCLEESLLLWYLLRSQDISATVRIGVRKEGTKFEAHAWVEREGVALNQRDEQHRHYAPFADELIKPTGEQP
jgi:Transglutaminase-like superfamily